MCLEAYVHTNGSVTTAPVWSIISNDLVIGYKDRYVQAKRHRWGVTDTAWVMKLFFRIPFSIWWPLASSVYYEELFRPLYVDGIFYLAFPGFWAFFWAVQPMTRYFLLGAFALWILYHALVFAVVEIMLWVYILPNNPKFPKVTYCNWAQMIVMALVSPITVPISRIMFELVPCLDASIHAWRTPYLTYICAPKAQLAQQQAALENQQKEKQQTLEQAQQQA